MGFGGELTGIGALEEGEGGLVFGGELGIGGVAARREEEACGLPIPTVAGTREAAGVSLRPGAVSSAMRAVRRPTFLSVVEPWFTR